jgi:enoyl-CoA hydratase/carnithine racemase
MTAGGEDIVLVDVKDAVGTSTLNRPARHNAFTVPMYGEILAALERLQADPEVKVIVLQGAGRSFSSGYDLKASHEYPSTLHRIRRNLADIGNECRWSIWNSPKPVLAKIHGYCLGGAFELAAPADFSICADDAQLGLPEVQFGSGSAFLMVPWLVNVKVAKDVMMTGRRISGAEADRMDLVTRSVPADELDAAVDELVQRLVAMPEGSLEQTKRGINQTYEIQGFRTAIEAWRSSAILMALSGDHSTDDYLKKQSRKS